MRKLFGVRRRTEAMHYRKPARKAAAWSLHGQKDRSKIAANGLSCRISGKKDMDDIKTAKQRSKCKGF